MVTAVSWMNCSVKMSATTARKNAVAVFPSALRGVHRGDIMGPAARASDCRTRRRSLELRTYRVVNSHSVIASGTSVLLCICLSSLPKCAR